MRRLSIGVAIAFLAAVFLALCVPVLHAQGPKIPIMPSSGGGAVASVAGKTGAVTLVAADVGPSGSDGVIEYNNAGVRAATAMTWNSVTSTLAGLSAITVSGSTAGAVALSELLANGSESITLQAPDSIATSYTIKPPAAVPSASDTLTVSSYSGGVAQLGWTAAASTTRTQTLNLSPGGANSALTVFPSSTLSANSSNGATLANMNTAASGQQANVGIVSFNDAATSYVTLSTMLPSGYQTAATATMRVWFWPGSGASASQVVKLSTESGCLGNGDNGAGGLTFNTADTPGITITSATVGAITVGSFNLTMTGCAANEKLVVRFARLGSDAADTMAARMDLLDVTLDVTVQ